MTAGKLIGGLVVLAIVVVVIIVVAMGGNNNKIASTTASNNMSNMDMSGSGSSSGSNAPSATNSVAIQNFAFSPANVTVKTGTTVTWTNKDSVAHTVTADSASADAPSSGDIGPGHTYSFTFKQAGTFKYHCSIHTDMLGTVTVTD